MGVLVGLLFGLGVFLLVAGRFERPEAVETTPTPGWRDRTQERLLQAGIEGVTPGSLVAVSVGLALVVAVLVLAISQVPVMALAFGGFAAYAPWALLRSRRVKRSLELREIWPEAVDNLASAIRAGLSLPEAVSALGSRGPEALRGPFSRFAADYRATGRFNDCLDRLKHNLADPVGDRVVEALRMAREVGGTDLGRLLRTLSAFLREDARTRAELETRQGWTVNGARLAVAAPWVILLLLSSNPRTGEAYRSATGALVLLVGAGVSFLAYRVMQRVARLPLEQRVLR
jgi:tight adherence protein B